ncbi:hypothetical protein L7F22_017928 [Adiantum nelumboides]|nr:hypothetical protein [Adiantum nelumboides]
MMVVGNVSSMVADRWGTSVVDISREYVDKTYHYHDILDRRKLKVVYDADTVPFKCLLEQATPASNLEGGPFSQGLQLMKEKDRTTLNIKEYEMSESLLDMASVKQEAKEALEGTEQQYGPDAISYAGCLQRCIENRDFAEGKRLHFSVVIDGLDYDSSFAAPLIRMYSFFQKLTEAQQVFSKLVEPNLFSWSAIMSAYGKFGQTEEVFKLYTQLQNSIVRLDGHGFVAVLQACSISSDLQWGRVIHNHVIESGWELDVFVGSTIIDMYSNCGHVADAHAVFNRLPSGNLVAWSALMKGYSQLDSIEEVLQLFAKMQQQGMNPDEVTFIGIIKACTGAVFKDAQHIHANIVKGGFEPNLWVGNALIDFYTRCNDLAAARIIFNKMPDQSPVAYSTLMSGYIQSNDGHQALQLYQHCHKNLDEPDLTTFVCTLKACTSLSDIIESGFEANVAIGSTVIDLYTKCGDLVNAHRHFLRLPARNIVTWNALITGYSQQEYCEKVFQYFDQLQGRPVPGFRDFWLYFESMFQHRLSGRLQTSSHGYSRKRARHGKQH